MISWSESAGTAQRHRASYGPELNALDERPKSKSVNITRQKMESKSTE